MREHNERAWLAWHIGALPKQKKFPDLNKLLIAEPRRPGRKQTADDMLAVVKMMNAALGGAVLGKILH